MNAERAAELVSNWNQQVLVVGDVMLDRFVWGDVNRFSPEAPSCPVLDFHVEDTMLGGAGNAAANIGALGAKCVRLVGLVGYDDYGRELQHMVNQDPGPVDFNVQRTASRRTTAKIRYVNREDNVHLLRFDHEEARPADAQEERNILYEIGRWAHLVAGIVIEDYGKGVVTREVIRGIMELAEKRNLPVFVDPKKEHWEHFRGAEVVKPNEVEAYAALGIKPGDEPIESVGEKLLKFTRAKAVIITRGSRGMSLFTSEGHVWAKPKPVKEVDPSGAGDTTMSTLALARIAGASWQEAMTLANTAAGIAVGKPGTSTVSAEELINSYGDENA